METTDPRALIIQHEPGGPGGQVAVRLAERGFEVTTHTVTTDLDEPNESVPFPDFEDHEVVIVMGSIRSLTRTDEIDSWIDDELNLIRKARDAGQPVLGICFGGQLISESLGGSVERSPITEIGWYEIEAIDGADNPAGAGPWMQWHHDRFSPPPGAELLARTAAGPQLFTIGRMAGTQFHPEVDVAHVQTWLGYSTDEDLAAYGLHREHILADTRLNEARNIVDCHALVDWFLDEVAFLDGKAR